MTDDRSLEIERYFDGELADQDRRPVLDRLAGDPEARRHLDRLMVLREVARRHDPAANIPRRTISPIRRRRPVPSWLAVASIAAAVALLCWPRARVMDPPRNGTEERSRLRSASSPLPTTDRLSLSTDRPPLEVELYGWANTPSRAPGQAARLVLGPASAAHKRSPADEILALELANATPKARGDVRRFAVSRGPKATSPARPPVPNPRSRAI